MDFDAPYSILTLKEFSDMFRKNASYRMFAMLMMSAKTPAAVTAAPAP